MTSTYHIYSKEHIYQLSSFEEDQRLIASVINQIAAQVELKADPESEHVKVKKAMEGFETFNGYPLVVLFDSYSINHVKPFKLLVVTTSSRTQRMVSQYQINSETVVEHEFVGLIRLKQSFPDTYIRPETIGDKINELIKPVEIDFKEHIIFSNKYYVLSSDEEAFRRRVNVEFLDAIAAYDGLEIEIRGNHLLVRTRSRISQKSAYKIVNFLGRLVNQ